MERIPIPKGFNTEGEAVLNRLMDDALGSPIILDAAPTTAGEELPENTLGFDGSNLFITLQGTTYKITLTAV